MRTKMEYQLSEQSNGVLRVKKYLMNAVLALACTGMAGGVVAVDQKAGVSLPTIPELRVQMAKLKTDLASPRNEYTNAQRAEMGNAIARIESRLGDRTTYASLTLDQQVAIVNDVSLLHSAVAARDQDDKMICEKSRKIGTNRISTMCRTAAQWAAIRKSSQDALNDEAFRACTGPGCI